jgi:hypothetical protein
LIALAFYLSQFLTFLSKETHPTTPEGWFELFQRSKVLGLFLLNALDVISITLLGLMFLALYVALRKAHPSIVAIAACLAFLGIAVFVSSRSEAVSATLSLSDRYVAARTEVERSQILAAGQAVHAPIRATPETAGFALVAVAGLILSVVMLQSQRFDQATAYVGISAGLVTLANNISIVLAPSLAAILMPINGLLWLIWWILVSHGLFKLAGASLVQRDSTAGRTGVALERGDTDAQNEGRQPE